MHQDGMEGAGKQGLDLSHGLKASRSQGLEQGLESQGLQSSGPPTFSQMLLPSQPSDSSRPMPVGKRVGIQNAHSC